MSEKSLVVVSSLGAGLNDVVEYPVAIPNGEKWVIRVFGAADINLGDNKSTAYILRFGTDILQPIITVTGNTYESRTNREVIGDGTKKVNVVRQNKSGFTKDCPFWIKAYKAD